MEGFTCFELGLDYSRKADNVAFQGSSGSAVGVVAIEMAISGVSSMCSKVVRGIDNFS